MIGATGRGMANLTGVTATGRSRLPAQMMIEGVPGDVMSLWTDVGQRKKGVMIGEAMTGGGVTIPQTVAATEERTATEGMATGGATTGMDPAILGEAEITTGDLVPGKTHAHPIKTAQRSLPRCSKPLRSLTLTANDVLRPSRIRSAGQGMRMTRLGRRQPSMEGTSDSSMAFGNRLIVWALPRVWVVAGGGFKLMRTRGLLEAGVWSVSIFTTYITNNDNHTLGLDSLLSPFLFSFHVISPW